MMLTKNQFRYIIIYNSCSSGMKRILFIIFLFIFVSKGLIYASYSIASDSSSMKNETVSYDLAYPGILPDNPLYILKTLRDRIVSILINDPLKKAEFDLLTSDKRLYAGYFLVNKNKPGLAIVSISKSNNYFFEAINNLSEAKKMGESTNSLASRMKLSVQKHEEMLRNIEKPMGEKYKDQLSFEYQRLVDFETSINSLLTK